MTLPSPDYYRERAYQILEGREHSVCELRQKLLRRGCPADTADMIAEQLQSDGLLDDVRFGCMFVRSKLRQNWSIKRVTFELQKKHQFAGDTLALVMEAYARECPDEGVNGDDRRAERIVERRWHSAKDTEKIFRYLVNRGFSASCARRALQARCGAQGPLSASEE